MSETKNIYQRINEVRKQVHYIRKDKKVEGQGYMAVTHDAVTALLRNHLIDEGVIVVARFIRSETVDVGKTQKGATIIRYSAVYEVDFVNMDQPDDKITVPMESHANDQGDKAPGKAASYATKYAMLKLFSLETGEKEEGRVEAYVEKITEEQAEAINERLERLDKDAVAGFMSWQKIKHVEDLGQPAYPACIKMLDKKLREVGKAQAEAEA